MAPIEYWQRRAAQLGRRSVLNIGHTDAEFEAVTELQKQILFPLLKTQLNGAEELALDFGCGPGRFTTQLAELIRGKAIGVDPIQDLLDLAPLAGCVEYRRLRDARIPCQDETVDLAWICLVLGGLTDSQALGTAAAEICRVLRPRGLLFLVENTSTRKNGDHWHFRSVSEYLRLFPCVKLAVLSDYSDLGETITVMAGRRDV